MSVVRASLLLSFIDKYVVLIITIISTMILARRLTPVETGVYTVAWSLINIAQALRDFGIFGYIVQEKELTRQRLATALTISLSLGTVLTCGFAASANLIANFYGDPRMTVLVHIMSFNFLLVSFASVGTALLQRAMNFRAMMRINIAAALVNSTTSVGLVYAGLGPVALAWSSLLGIVVLTAYNFCYIGRQILLPPSFAAWRRIAEFGILSSGAALLSVMSSRAAELSVGRLLGLESAGLFSRGSGLITLFQQALMNAIMPVTGAELSRLHRENQNIRSAFLDGISYITGVAWPFLAMLGLMAHAVIVIFYGGQWVRAIPIAQILCFATAAGIMANLTMVLFNAMGAVRQNFMIQAMTLPVYVVAVVCGSLIDLRAAAFGVVIASIASAFLALSRLNRQFGTTWRDIGQAVARSVLVTLATAIVPALMLFTWGYADDRLWPVTIMAGIGGGLCWLGALHAVDHPLWKHLLAAFGMLRAKMAFVTGNRARDGRGLQDPRGPAGELLFALHVRQRAGHRLRSRPGRAARDPFRSAAGRCEPHPGLFRRGIIRLRAQLHCLEHMHDPEKSLKDWWALVKPGGFLITVVPDEDLYEQGIWPSLFNSDHKSSFRLTGNGSWSPVSRNLKAMVQALPGARLVSEERQDRGYVHQRPLWRGRFPAPLRRVVFRLYNRLRRYDRLLDTPVERFAIRAARALNCPIDQTLGKALAQIQVIAQKDGV